MLMERIWLFMLMADKRRSTRTARGETRAWCTRYDDRLVIGKRDAVLEYHSCYNITYIWQWRHLQDEFSQSIYIIHTFMSSRTTEFLKRSSMILLLQKDYPWTSLFCHSLNKGRKGTHIMVQNTANEKMVLQSITELNTIYWNKMRWS